MKRLVRQQGGLGSSDGLHGHLHLGTDFSRRCGQHALRVVHQQVRCGERGLLVGRVRDGGQQGLREQQRHGRVLLQHLRRQRHDRSAVHRTQCCRQRLQRVLQRLRRVNLQVRGEGPGERGQQRADGGAAGGRRVLQQEVKQKDVRRQRRGSIEGGELWAQKARQPVQRHLSHGRRGRVCQAPRVQRGEHLQQQSCHRIGREHDQQLLARREDAAHERQRTAAQQRSQAVAHELLLGRLRRVQLLHQQRADLLLRGGVVRRDTQEERTAVLQ